ncbi:MAG: hypothetical protein U0746_09785 [Gemmataceae bacterium]
MRCAIAAVVVLFAAVAHGADDAPKASGMLNGQRLKFPEKGVANGVKATIGLLASCHDESLFAADELKKALLGDHVRLEFPKPVTAEVMNKKVEFSELVFRRPLNTGVFWVRSGDTWRRYTKYEFPKEKPFVAWLAEAQVAARCSLVPSPAASPESVRLMCTPDPMVCCSAGRNWGRANSWEREYG